MADQHGIGGDGGAATPAQGSGRKLRTYGGATGQKNPITSCPQRGLKTRTREEDKGPSKGGGRGVVIRTATATGRPPAGLLPPKGVGNKSKTSREEVDSPKGRGHSVEKGTENGPRQEAKRRKGTAVTPDSEGSAWGGESRLQRPAASSVEKPEWPQDPGITEKGNFPLTVTTAEERNDPWFFETYVPTTNPAPQALILPTGTVHPMAPHSAESSNAFPGDTLGADLAVAGEGLSGLPLGEEENEEAWGLAAVDLWLTDENGLIFPPP